MSARVRKKEILSDDFKKRKIFWKNIAENFWKIFHLTSPRDDTADVMDSSIRLTTISQSLMRVTLSVFVS
jgi:hypothetical protein